MFDDIDFAYNYISNQIRLKGFILKDQRGDTIKSLPFISVSFWNFYIESGNVKIPKIPKFSKIQGQALENYAKQLQNDNLQDFVYTYGNRFMKYFDVNQYEVMKEKLKEDHNTRRAVAITFDVVNDNDKENIPCLQFIQLMVYDEYLYMTVVFRSNDITYAFCSNMYALMKLHIKFADDLGLKVGKFNYVGNNVHLKNV